MNKPGLAKGVYWLDAWVYYVAKIMTEEFDSESIRKGLLELWGVKGRRGILRYKLRRKLVKLNNRYWS